MIRFSAQKNLQNFQMDMDFELPKGLHCMFGPSGAGKSLSLKIFAGLYNADNEEISLNGKMLSSSHLGFSLPPQKRKVGFVFQRPTVFPHMNVKENILFGSQSLDQDQKIKECEQIMKLLQITELKDLSAHQLSGGQAQRVSIARTLVNKPELLILDEPFTALDTPLRVRLRKDIKEATRELGISTILVTHDLIEAMDMCDQMLLIHEGKILQQGTPTDLINNPKNEHVARYMDLKNYEYQRPL